MKALSFFTVSLLIHLIVSRGLFDRGRFSAYMFDTQSLPAILKERPVDVILEKRNKTGFFIKTYYVVLKVVYGYGSHRRMKVRTSRKFWKGSRNSVGMSIFRKPRGEDAPEEYTLMPPGSLFVGDADFGFWSVQKSGIQVWTFRKDYGHFPKLLGWGDFRPDKTFYNGILAHRIENRNFYGTNRNFGNGQGVVLKNLPRSFEQEMPKKSLSVYFKKLFAVPRVGEKL